MHPCRPTPRSLTRQALMVLSVTLAVAPAAAQDSLPPLPVACLIEPYEIVRLTPATAGIVARVLVDRGDTVEAGALLMEMDSAAEETALALVTLRAEDHSRLDALRARHDFMDQQARRLEALAERGNATSNTAIEARMEAEVAARTLDEAQVALNQIALERRAAEIALERRRMTAPIGGTVVDRQVTPGEYRDTEAPVLTLAQVDRLRIEAFAPISHFNRIRLGQEVTIRPEAPVGGAYTARVTVVDRVFDAATATFGFRMEMDNTEANLPAGLRCEVEF